jgi:hypothetical protein
LKSTHELFRSCQVFERLDSVPESNCQTLYNFKRACTPSPFTTRVSKYGITGPEHVRRFYWQHCSKSLLHLMVVLFLNY